MSSLSVEAIETIRAAPGWGCEHRLQGGDPRPRLLLVTTTVSHLCPRQRLQQRLGTGHVSLEPSLLTALKLSRQAYLQTQSADWIPLGGWPGFTSDTFHFRAAEPESLPRRHHAQRRRHPRIQRLFLPRRIYRFPSRTVGPMSGGCFSTPAGMHVQFLRPHRFRSRHRLQASATATAQAKSPRRIPPRILIESDFATTASNGPLFHRITSVGNAAPPNLVSPRTATAEQRQEDE